MLDEEERVNIKTQTGKSRTNRNSCLQALQFPVLVKSFLYWCLRFHKLDYIPNSYVWPSEKQHLDTIQYSSQSYNYIPCFACVPQVIKYEICSIMIIYLIMKYCNNKNSIKGMAQNSSVSKKPLSQPGPPKKSNSSTQ